jgi:hypothetical protein
MPSELYFDPSIVELHLALEIVGMFYRTTTFSIYESSSLVSFLNTPHLPVNIAVKHLIQHYKVRLTGEEEDLEILQTLKEVTAEYVRVTITKPQPWKENFGDAKWMKWLAHVATLSEELRDMGMALTFED